VASPGLPYPIWSVLKAELKLRNPNQKLLPPGGPRTRLATWLKGSSGRELFSGNAGGPQLDGSSLPPGFWERSERFDLALGPSFREGPRPFSIQRRPSIPLSRSERSEAADDQAQVWSHLPRRSTNACAQNDLASTGQASRGNGGFKTASCSKATPKLIFSRTKLRQLRLEARLRPIERPGTRRRPGPLPQRRRAAHAADNSWPSCWSGRSWQKKRRCCDDDQDR
jgi:hypothetical protein